MISIMYFILLFYFLIHASPIFLPSTDAACPVYYQRFSQEHTYCKPANTSCQIVAKGITKDNIKEILAAHNKYRSKLAQGEENIGELPPATNMLEMVWDDELAEIAQKHTEQCVYAHDCHECRQVPNFRTGQNIWTSWGATEPTRKKQGFASAVGAWYDEVNDFQRPLIDSWTDKTVDKVIGHFTQVAWAKSFRVGCGYSAFKDKGDTLQELFTCNYGPGGNIYSAKIYQKGNTCSECPLNADCRKETYPGLCKLTNPGKPPVYKPTYPADEKKLFYCDFSNEYMCPMKTEGKSWKRIIALSGAYASVVLNGGESTTLKIDVNIKSPKSTCISVYHRNGPDKAGDKAAGTAHEVVTIPAAGNYVYKQPLNNVSPSFGKYQLGLSYGGYEYQLSYTFSVPAGSPPQFFEITDILIMEGDKC